MIEAIGGGMLNRQELPRIRVVLYIAISFHEQLVACHETATPASHVEALARRVQFDANFLRFRCSQKAQRLAFKYQGRIGSIMNDDDAISSCEFNHFGKELRRRARAGRIIRIIDHQHLRLAENVSGN